MAEFNAQITEAVLAACVDGAEEAAGALSRALDNTFRLTVGKPASYNPDTTPDGFEGPGLAIAFKFEEGAALIALPETTGLLPEWTKDPDPTGQSKLDTLAQEISMLTMPDDFFADEFSATYVSSLSATMGRAKLATDAATISIEISGKAVSGDEEKTGHLTLVWPAEAAIAALTEPSENQHETSAAEEDQTSKPEAASTEAAPTEENESAPATAGFSRLPAYSRSLLKIKVPMIVNLASKKMSVKEITHICPGTIIKFDKAYDESLEMNVGNQRVAQGEVVKVGERFGIRIHSIIMPYEHFSIVKKTG